jgi:hypothetical protein
MEAIHIEDPGWYLILENGLRFYVWRRAVLKHMGKKLTDRVFPSFPPFKFSFFSSDVTGALNDITCHATYGHFYDSWYQTVFNSDTFAFGEFLEMTFWPEPRLPGTDMPMGFQTCVDYASWRFVNRRNLLEAEALLNAAAETGFWFMEMPYKLWDQRMEVLRAYKAADIWKPAINNDTGAVERHRIINRSMHQQGIAVNTEFNVPIFPFSTSIFTRRTMKPTLRKLPTQDISEDFEKFFDFDTASGEDTSAESARGETANGTIVREEIHREEAARGKASADIPFSLGNQWKTERPNSLDLVDPEEQI